MLPFSSNVNSIKLGKINFLKSCYDRFCVTVLNCALRMGYISIKKKTKQTKPKQPQSFLLNITCEECVKWILLTLKHILNFEHIHCQVTFHHYIL